MITVIAKGPTLFKHKLPKLSIVKIPRVHLES